MGRFVRLAAAFAVSVACTVGAPTLALAGDDVSAETLFQAGLEAMKKNDYAVACEAFQQSNAADPSPGTQINLALCFEKQKKWASAWTWYRKAVGLAQQRAQPEREKLAQDSANRLKPRLHNIVVSVKEPLTDLVVKRDGTEFPITLAGKEVPTPIDPGEHTIEVSARGKKPWTKTIAIADDNKTERIEVPKLEDAPVETKASPEGGAPAPAAGADYRPPVVVASDGSSQRTVGLVVGGAGILAAIAAGGVQLLALKEESRAEEAEAEFASKNPGKTIVATDRREAADNNQLIATVTGAGAVALLATGAVIFFTAPKGKAAARPNIVPLLGPTHAGLGLGGAF